MYYEGNTNYQAALHASHRCGLLLKTSHVPAGCLLDATVSPTKTAEPIEMSFVGQTRVTRCTVAPPDEYDRTVRAWRRCVLMSDYFDRLS